MSLEKKDEVCEGDQILRCSSRVMKINGIRNMCIRGSIKEGRFGEKVREMR